MTATNSNDLDPDFDWSPHMKGYLLSSFFYGYALMQVPAGVIVKRVPANLMFGFGVFVSAILSAIMPLIARHFAILLICRVVMGVFQAAAVPCILNFMTNWAPPLERSRMSQLSVAGAFAGTVVIFPLSGVVGEKLGWQWIFYVVAAIALVWCIVWAIFIRNTPEQDKFISDRELEYITNSISEEKRESVPPTPWKEILTSVPVLSLAITNFSWGWGFTTMLTQLPAFLKGKNTFLLHGEKMGLLQP